MRQSQTILTIRTRGQDLTDITDDLNHWIRETGLSVGLLTVFCQHTSASLTIQENADPAVRHDLEVFLKRIVPEDPHRYRHVAEGDDDMPAHIRAMLTDVSLSIPVGQGRMLLGDWQAVYLMEHRARGHSRHIVLHLIGEDVPV